MKQITKICVWDFDGTLIDSPLPDTGKIIYKEKTGVDWKHIGWWSKSESLDMSIFNIPLIESTYQSYLEEIKNENSLNIMMTGRQQNLSKEVELILNNNNLVFDNYIYNRGGTTIDSKIKSLDRLLIEYPLVDSILITDDRLEHIPIFEEWLNNHKISGRLKEIKINVVPSDL